MHADFDPGLAAVIGLVRELHGPIEEAITKGALVTSFDAAALAGAVGALLDAIDARTSPAPVQALKAVA